MFGLQAMLYDRHIHALKKVIKHYSNGFVMKDLVAVFKILNVCADRSDEHPVYIEPMLAMLKICKFPFLMEKSSDEISFEQIAIESISQLGMYSRTFLIMYESIDSLITDKINDFHILNHKLSRLHLYNI